MKNNNFTIKKYEIYNKEQNLAICFAFNSKSHFTRFATWEVRGIKTDNPDFFWGHYFTDKMDALKDYHERLAYNYTNPF